MFAAAAGLLITAVTAHPATASICPPALGQPDAITYVVPDVQAARQQVERGTGAVFTSLQRTVTLTVSGQRTAQPVMLTASVYDPPQGPALELVQVSSPGSGAWSGDGRGHVALSYSVADVRRYASELRRAGLRQIATGEDIAIWRGAGGVTIRLDEHLPAAAPPVTSAAPINLGAPVSIALYPCDPAALTAQLTRALSLSWRSTDTYQLPWTLADGSAVSPSSTSTTSQTGLPYVTVANASSHGFPGEDICGIDYLPSYLVYAASDVTAANAQLAGAGLQFIGTVPALITLHIGAGRVPIQVVHTSFAPQS
ncbi:hypothetical protein [Micromonospora aurantiaca (nom. illeg.)]|uniref:hypothetical protein n=1 Tax=Micromonospora aurantiaca (nom. illeg.) TaxID=47850 RepID=UPI0033EACBCE